MSNLIVIPTLEGIPLKNITDPVDADVLCGRGGASQRHVGNLTYRRLVNLNKGFYISCLKSEKLRISRSIVAAIRQQRGRFLERDGDYGTWYDIGDKKAVEKTSQALREGQPKLRQRMVEIGTSDPETGKATRMPIPTGQTPLPPHETPSPQAPPKESRSGITMINPVANQHSAFINNCVSMHQSMSQMNQPFLNRVDPQNPQDHQLQLQLQHRQQHQQLQSLLLQPHFQRQQEQQPDMQPKSQQQNIMSHKLQQSPLINSGPPQPDVNLMNIQLQNELMLMQALTMRSTGGNAVYQSHGDARLPLGVHHQQQLHEQQQQQLQQLLPLPPQQYQQDQQQREQMELQQRHQHRQQKQQQKELQDRRHHRGLGDEGLGSSNSSQIDLLLVSNEPQYREQRQQNQQQQQQQQKKLKQFQSGCTPFTSSSLPPLPNTQRSQTLNLMCHTTTASPTLPASSTSDTTTVVAATTNTSNGATRKVDRRRLFAKMKVSRPASGRFDSCSISNRSLGTEGTSSDLYNMMLDSQFSLMSNLSSGNGTKQDGSSTSKRMIMESPGKPGATFRDPNSIFSDNFKREDYIMALESRRSLMSGLSKISDSSDVQSMFSDLSKKIGNVSTRSIAMSEISGVEEEYQEDLEESLTIASKATAGSSMEEEVV